MGGEEQNISGGKATQQDVLVGGVGPEMDIFLSLKSVCPNPSFNK